MYAVWTLQSEDAYREDCYLGRHHVVWWEVLPLGILKRGAGEDRR